ncbi:ectoine/hydroxyectoine ABC transporter substrate-binding protein EhuB [Maritimibacter sp. 55A14]|uniref:ectoine/hydroxyectoine ABC transporter substrate-binding protein EhuB n=1 Tax=Maritimibacter sp. 55A14 TaxID=2174844 RepID=UPI000D617CF2|nr:ectoine/hydroxyectoine ABC transporter substrate-binding protein EhuB [Maritimibacter sp. 55A14]PWE31379.1 ectoine/hydroxyectoine ABC transporter substrate-binding protein EhuB [Maritimibacter sp. 55A14]
MRRDFLKLAVSAAALAFAAPMAAQAGQLMDRIEAGETIRIGFANEVPWAYPGEGNEPLGFVNAHALGVLEQMGYTDIEPVVTDWGGLIPGLKAGRFDIITGGMYILKSRCENVNFSEPMAQVSDAFIVASGNPKGIQTYKDLIENDAVMVTGAGFNTVEAAKKEGVPDAQVMQVPGPTEILAAVRSGRADAGAVTFFTAQELAANSGGEVEVTNPAALPEWTQNWVGIAFRPGDQDFLDEFNAAQDAYLGSDEMLAAVAPYGYDEKVLPGDASTEWVCENR